MNEQRLREAAGSARTLTLTFYFQYVGLETKTTGLFQSGITKRRRSYVTYDFQLARSPRQLAYVPLSPVSHCTVNETFSSLVETA